MARKVAKSKVPVKPKMAFDEANLKRAMSEN